jgi:hypothetical protein
MNKLIQRLKEPSTYAGLAGLAVILGLEAEQFQWLANSVAGVFAFASILLGESDA